MGSNDTRIPCAQVGTDQTSNSAQSHLSNLPIKLLVLHVTSEAIIAGSLESANSSILAARRHFKEVVGKKIRILL